MALTIIDPGMMTVLGQWWISLQQRPGARFDLSNLTDSAGASPAFDTQHAVYTSPIVDQASQDSIGDNSNGLEDPLMLEPTLTYTYTSGYSNTRTSSDALTVGVEQQFDYEFAGIGGSTKLTASGTFTWGQGTSEDNTKSVSQSLLAPFNIPKGKIYEEKLLFAQEQAAVPYRTTIYVDGYIAYPDLDPNNAQGPIGAIFYNAYNAASPDPIISPPPPAYKDVNWEDVYIANVNTADQFKGIYWFNGTLTIQDAGIASVKIYDITNGTSQAIQAEYETATSIGVHRTMDDAGRRFLDTPFDDWVDGGRGDDRITLRGGADIVHAGAGDDRISASGVGRSLLDGGAGDDRIELVSTASYHTILGGAGNDRITADAPASMIYGGAGNDRVTLRDASAGGTVITDAEGDNRLQINTSVPLGFERINGSDNLYILLGGGETYDRARDVVWVDFFANPDNRVNGLRAERIERLATTPDPQGQDTLTLYVSEDAWLGDAQFTIQVNGETVGSPRIAFASHAAGDTQAYVVQGDFGPGPLQVGVMFLNDAWGGTPETDRNLYLDGVGFNGAAFLEQPVTLWSNGSVAVSVDATRGGPSLGAGLTFAASSADLGQLAGLAGGVAS